MNITRNQIDKFESMMSQIANTHRCDISLGTINMEPDNPEQPMTEIAIAKGTKRQIFHVVWDKASSLTDAAVAIWASWFEYYYTKATPTYVPYSEMSSKYYIRNNAEPTVQILPDLSHSIKNVIFNDPATIVFWGDGTKTVVKCGEDDIFDPEKGLAMAISKKFLGNQGNYYNEIRKWVGADLYMNEKTHNDLESLFDNVTVDALAENMRNLLNRLEGRK